MRSQSDCRSNGEAQPVDERIFMRVGTYRECMDACCKVGRIIERYNLQHGIGGMDLESYLVARWLGESDYAATGLRPLADWLNRKLLKTVYNEQGRNALDSRVQSDYEALSGGESAIAVVDDLAVDGIDGERLQSDFVSATTLYRHFTNCLGVTKDDDAGETDSEWEREKIDYARDVVRKNVEDSLRSLENKGRLPRGSEAAIKTEIVLGCPDCATQVSVERAIERGYICEDHR